MYHMSPYLRLVSCCVLWGMCRSSVCLLPNWTMVCVSYVPILTAGVMLCIVGDVQKFSMSFAKLDHGLCVVCPHTYGWCHVVYCGGCAEVQCIFCQTGPWFVCRMSPYFRLVSCCVLWGMCRSSVSFAKLDHGLCVVCPHNYGWCHVVYCGGCAEVHWTMVCVLYVPILTAGVMLCIVGDVQRFSVSLAKLDHGLCVVCPHTYGWCHVVHCGGCAEVHWTIVCVSYVPILPAGVMLCIVGEVQKFSVFCQTGPCFVCHMSPYLRLVSCCVLLGMCRSSLCLLPNWTMFCVSYVPILTAGVMLCIVGEVQKFTGPWFMCFMSSYLLLVSYYALQCNTFVIYILLFVKFK